RLRPTLDKAAKNIHKERQQRPTFDLPSDASDITLSDIERYYEIGRVIGDGNFAVVRECRRRDNRQTLALKIVERSKLLGREHMMQNELSLLGSLCHPRIVRLFAHYHTHSHSYLVMELVSGGDLFEAISERGKFSEAEAGLMVSDMSEALNYIHCKSIVHRDLKPENLLVGIMQVAAGICRLKLGDFGLAMVVTEPVFTICGTPTYVAPEILFETGYGVAVDIWALGVILYILLCGFPPFRSRDRDQEELFQLIKQGQLHFPSPYWDLISEEARGLVRALLQPDPTVRLTAEQTLLHPWQVFMVACVMTQTHHHFILLAVHSWESILGLSSVCLLHIHKLKISVPRTFYFSHSKNLPYLLHAIFVTVFILHILYRACNSFIKTIANCKTVTV
uniref:non-specific serine/threonine protein kinase n=1 Tax=Mastacembelus armatus TaxID=205130 RepID=A0A7N9B1X7_9TELE